MERGESELSAERQARLLEQLQVTGRVVTSDAAASSGVSVDTIRRDLLALEGLGQARRVHGGAVLHSSVPRSFRERSADTGSEVAGLAEVIVNRLQPGQVIGLDAGTTGVEIARRIPMDLPLTIVTTNPPAAVTLELHRLVTVVLVGGILDLTWMAVTGAEAVKTIDSFRLDTAVLGACAVHWTWVPQRTPSERSRSNVLGFRRQPKSFCLPLSRDHRVAPFVVCPLDEVSVVVCSDELPEQTRRRYRRKGVTLLSR